MDKQMKYCTTFQTEQFTYELCKCRETFKKHIYLLQFVGPIHNQRYNMHERESVSFFSRDKRVHFNIHCNCITDQRELYTLC